MEKDLIFFGENGLTSTSANHVANLAKEYYKTLERDIDSIHLYSTSVSNLKGDTTILTKRSNIDELDAIQPTLNKIAECKGLIAWLREAIKARQDLITEVKATTIEEYVAMKGECCLEEPKRKHYLTEEEYIANLSIKDRQRYYSLEAKCSTIGKYIHPDGKLTNMRADLEEKLKSPSKLESTDVDTLIFHYAPMCDVSCIDQLMFKLQNAHREVQAELNSIKYNMEKALLEDKTKKDTEYAHSISEYNSWLVEKESELKEYINEKVKEISSYKIVIPHNLESIYQEVSKR